MVYMDKTTGNQIFNIAIAEVLENMPPNRGKYDVFGKMTGWKFHVES
ncbi:MAG: hypothetical protein VYA34_08700 [Myxococcota bacterium]|nr:hypothetical protein [Myxococcota bacterium]